MNSRPLRIVHVIARMNVGGPAILISELINGLNSKDFESYLITGYCETNEIDFLQVNNLKLNEKRIKGLGRSVSIIGDFKSVFLVMKALRKIKPDIVHTHTAKAGVIGRLTALIAVPKAKRVHTFHGHLLQGYFSPFKTKVVVIIEKLLGKFTDLILTVGNRVKKDLLVTGIGIESKMQVTFPGITVKTTVERKQKRSELGILEDEILLIYVGRLTQIKRVDRLINSFKKASDINQGITLLVVGDGELRESLQKDSPGLKIKFLGWRTDVYDLMNASDMAILTSDNEGMPITLIEAAHLGLPAISTNVGSVSDVVKDEITGFLTSQDETEISQKIIQLAGSPSLREKLGSAAKKQAKENFSTESMVQFHANAYRILLNRAN